MRYIVFILLLFVMACRSVQPVQVVTNTVRVDSIVTIPPDSAWLEALIECDSNHRAYVKEILGYQGGKTIEVPTVVFKDRILIVTAKHDTIYKPVVMVRKAQVFVKVTNVLTTMQRVFYFAGLIWTGVLILFVLFIILKRRYL
jgi:hypothetical protein